MIYIEFCRQVLSVQGTMKNLITLAAILLAGCAQMRGNVNTMRVTMQDSGSSITLHMGDVLEVALPATFGTGYSWKVANAAGHVVKLRGKPETAPGESQNKTGQTETQVFRFVASAKGTGQLELHYVRPWEKDEKPAKLFSLKIQVQ